MKLWLLLLLLFFQFHAFATDCENRATKELTELIKSDHQSILKKQYTLTALKLAQLAGGNTLEGYARKVEKSIPRNNLTLKRLNEIYSKYQMNTDYESVLENMKSTLYWKKSLRFYNDDISAFILLQKQANPDSKLNNSDAAIAWLASKSFNSLPKGQKEKNHSNLSTHVAFINGVVKSSHALPPTQITQRIEKLSHSIQNDLNNSLRYFSQNFRSQCSQLFDQMCHNQDLLKELFSKAIRSNVLTLDNPKIKQSLLKRELDEQLKRVKFTLSTSEIPTTKMFNAPTPKLPQYAYLNRYSNMQNFKEELNTQSDLYLLQTFHKNLSPSKYGVISKKSHTLKIYTDNGELLTEVSLKDDINIADNTPPGIGAGIFYLTSNFPDGTLNLQGERKNRTNIPLSRVSTICDTPSHCQSSESQDFQIIYKYLTPKDPIYILPEEEGNTFLVKNGVINYTTLIPRTSYAGRYYSPRNNKCLPVKAYITEPSYNTPLAKRFVSTLVKEKENLMKLYRLDNDEYNDLMKLAFGILGNESKFGKSPKYHIKESLPFVVSLLKGNGLDTSQNSRGPTQIKRVPKKISEHYNVTKSTLGSPDKAAVATLGYLAEALQELKSKEKIARSKGLVINGLNRMDYVHYIYMGRSSEITKGTATPELNIYLRQVKEFSKDLVLLQSQT